MLRVNEHCKIKIQISRCEYVPRVYAIAHNLADNPIVKHQMCMLLQEFHHWTVNSATRAEML